MTKPLPNSIEDYFRSGLSPHGWMQPYPKGAALAFHVLKYKPSYAVEIGVYSGRSLITIALAMKENGSGIVHGIDPWEADASIAGFPEGDANHSWWKKLDHTEILKDCNNSIDRLGVRNHVELWQYRSEQVAGVFNNGIELAHIDGNHSEASALFDVTAWAPKVKTGGFVWMDDCDWETTKPAQRKLAETCRLIEMVGTCGVYEKL